MSDHGERARITGPGPTPAMQVGHEGLAIASSRLDSHADFLDHGMVHLPVEQHLALIRNEPLRPERDKDRTDDAHDRVELGPAKPSSCPGKDSQHDVEVRKLQVQVVIVGAVMVRGNLVVNRLGREKPLDEPATISATTTSKNI